MDARRTPSLSIVPPPSRVHRFGWGAVLVIAVALAIGAGMLAASRPDDPSTKPVPRTAEFGGLTWEDITIGTAGEGDGATVRASVALDGAQPTRVEGRGDDFVSYRLVQRLDDGDVRDVGTSDDSDVARALEFSDQLTFMPGTGEGWKRGAGSFAGGEILPDETGEYTLSRDGSVEFTNVPAGRYELIAYDMSGSFAWNGGMARRTITVRAQD